MKTGLIISAALGGFLGYLSGGAYLFKVIGYCILLPLGCFLLLLPLIAKLNDGKQEKVRDPNIAKFLVIPVFLISALLGGEGILRYRRYEVEKFVEETIPLLDAHWEEFGEYPPNLQQITEQKFPYYFRNRRPFDQPYSSNGNRFSFSYTPADSMLSGLVLSSSSRSWSRAD